jgi:hypothetical protein
MESHGRIDPAGALQLGGVAVLFATIAVYVNSLTAHLGLLPATVIGVTAAAAAVLLQNWEWERLGGRPAVVMTNRWIRTRKIPSTVPPQIWGPLLAKREARAVKHWSLLILSAVQIPLPVINLLDPKSASERLLWLGALAFWVGLTAWTLYYNLRWLPVIRRLLEQEFTPERLPSTEDQHVDSNS